MTADKIPFQLKQFIQEQPELRQSSLADALNKKERAEYPRSVFRNIMGLSRRESLSGIAGAVSRCLETLNPGFTREENEFLLALDLLAMPLQQRALESSIGSSGGFLVGVDVLPM